MFAGNPLRLVSFHPNLTEMSVALNDRCSVQTTVPSHFQLGPSSTVSWVTVMWWARIWSCRPVVDGNLPASWCEHVSSKPCPAAWTRSTRRWTGWADAGSDGQSRHIKELSVNSKILMTTWTQLPMGIPAENAPDSSNYLPVLVCGKYMNTHGKSLCPYNIHMPTASKKMMAITANKDVVV